jgi:hypothetical protein
LNDFEVTYCDEEAIYIGKCKEALWATRQAKANWFQPQGGASSSNKGKGEDNPPKIASKELDENVVNSDDSISLDSEEDGEGSLRRVRMRYPEWKELQHMKDKVELVVGLDFREPFQFKETLKLTAVQNSFDFKYTHNEKKQVPVFCKKNYGWRVHASWTLDNKYFQIKTLFDVYNCVSHYYNKRATIK